MVVLGVVDFNHIHEALEESARLIGVISAIHPGVIADSYAPRELQFLNFRMYCWVLHA